MNIFKIESKMPFSEQIKYKDTTCFTLIEESKIIFPGSDPM